MSGEDAPAQQQNADEQKPQQQDAESKAESPKTENKPEATPAEPDATADAAAAAAAPAEASAAPADKPAEEDAFTYRALVLTGYGGYDKVKLQVKKGKPVLKPGEVMVRVKACGLNFADLMARQGLYDRLPSPPVTPGMECSGVVEAVGEEVTDRKSFKKAAALPVNYISTYMMVFDFGHLRPSQSVLIYMAAGGVGIAATQLCKTVKDVTIFGTASASKHEVISEGGVTHPIDYRSRDYVEEVRKINPKGVDIVLDPLGGSDTHKGYNLLKPMGKLISYGAANMLSGQKKNLFAVAKTWYQQFSIHTLSLCQNNRAVCGFHLGYLDSELVVDVMKGLLDLYQQGKIKPRIDSTYHLEQVGDAMRRMQERGNIGKIILSTEPMKEEPKKEEAKKDEKEKKEDKKKEEKKKEDKKKDESKKDEKKKEETKKEEKKAEEKKPEEKVEEKNAEEKKEEAKKEEN
ncbi:synaptic vesicle membrane protein VAT-1-like [Silurus asotus]|uniref:Synaptic vesicle membrane protein VAT-1-like n=1 Tax=Silurus asotus TaxID=30991 RepID=A0AAD5AN67_SILAS|nr:synaptic vesicle membrane protein VAT-1-like [Silurus asotus]